MKEKTIELKPFKVIYSESGMPFGFNLTRSISEEEVLYLVEKSLGLELAKFDEKSDLYKKNISNMTEDLEKLIKGQIKVTDFFDEYSFGSNLTAGNLGSMMQILTDLIRLDLIE